MRQTAGYSLEVAQPVAIGILKGSGIDLVNYRAAPPIRTSACLQSHQPPSLASLKQLHTKAGKTKDNCSNRLFIAAFTDQGAALIDLSTP
jgi:hypothetical protein